MSNSDLSAIVERTDPPSNCVCTHRMYLIWKVGCDWLRKLGLIQFLAKVIAGESNYLHILQHTDYLWNGIANGIFIERAVPELQWQDIIHGFHENFKIIERWRTRQTRKRSLKRSTTSYVESYFVILEERSCTILLCSTDVSVLMTLYSHWNTYQITLSQGLGNVSLEKCAHNMVSTCRFSRFNKRKVERNESIWQMRSLFQYIGLLF